MVSKRERAKQRKAAAAKNPTSNNVKVGHGIRQDRRQIIKVLSKFPTTRIVELVKKGDGVTTTALSESHIKGISLEKSGVLSAVLGLLQRCEDETFDEVIDDITFLGHGNVPWGKVALLDTPSTWIDILMEAEELEPSCLLQIAENIGPMVRCICDDTNRLFFKSNEHWRKSIKPCAGLIYNMLSTSIEGCKDNIKVIDTLFNHVGLLRCVIQWGFWEHRLDIAKELPAEDFETIIKMGNSAATLATAISGDCDCLQLLENIGTTPIVNKEHDPNCMISYTAGLVLQMNRQGKNLDEFPFPLIQTLILSADCVDGVVIGEIIRYGTNVASDLVNADRLTRLSYPMLLQKTDTEKRLPCDTRTAAAIRAGLIEMCLNFIGRFGGHESFHINDDCNLSLFVNIEYTFQSIYNVSLHQKTAKAIRSKRGGIEDNLVRLEQNNKIANNHNCKLLLSKVRSILDINGSFCCRCNKSLNRTEVKQCNGCGHMTYCSKACQKEDWLDGHSATCCSKSYSHEEAGHFQGRIFPLEALDNERDDRKMEELEKNVTMIQLKLFLDHSETILRQAEALDIPLCDCVVKIDLRYCPPRVAIKCYTEFCQAPEHRMGFEESRSKDNIMCIYASSLFIVGYSEDRLAMQRFFPHEWLVEQSK